MSDSAFYSNIPSQLNNLEPAYQFDSLSDVDSEHMNPSETNQQEPESLHSELTQSAALLILYDHVSMT